MEGEGCIGGEWGGGCREGAACRNGREGQVRWQRNKQASGSVSAGAWTNRGRLTLAIRRCTAVLHVCCRIGLALPLLPPSPRSRLQGLLEESKAELRTLQVGGGWALCVYLEGRVIYGPRACTRAFWCGPWVHVPITHSATCAAHAPRLPVPITTCPCPRSHTPLSVPGCLATGIQATAMPCLPRMPLQSNSPLSPEPRPAWHPA